MEFRAIEKFSAKLCTYVNVTFSYSASSIEDLLSSQQFRPCWLQL